MLFRGVSSSLVSDNHTRCSYKYCAVDKTEIWVGFGIIEDCYIWGSHRSNGLITKPKWSGGVAAVPLSRNQYSSRR